VTALVSLHQVNVAAHFGDRFIGLREGEKLFDVERGELTPELIDDLYGSVETVSLAEQEGAVESTPDDTPSGETERELEA